MVAPMVTTDLLQRLLVDTPEFPVYDSHSDRIALIGMFSALGVAVVTGVFATFNNRGDRTRRSRVVPNCSAWERWLLLHGFDPRRIRTGYESEDDVVVIDDDDGAG